MTRAYRVGEVRRVASAMWLDIMWDGIVAKIVCRLCTEVHAHSACDVTARALYGPDFLTKKFFKISDFQSAPPATKPRSVPCLDIKKSFDEIALEIN